MTTDINRLQALVRAIEAGDVADVRALLAAHPELATGRDGSGATALHYAAFNANREIIDALIAAGADVNARDGRHGATPAGWAIHTLRERGGLLAIEIEDVRFAIERGDAEWVDRLVARHPSLLDAIDREGKPLRQRADESSSSRIRRVFET